MLSPVMYTLISLCVTLLILWNWKRNRNLPPGPKGLPFFGYYPFLSKQPHLDLARLAKHYGDVISFRTVGGSLIVVLNSVNAMKEVLINRAEEFIGRPLENNLLEWISDGLGVTQEEGQSWKEHRRFFLQTVKHFGFGKLQSEEMIHVEIEILLKDLKKADGQTSDFRFHVCYVVNSVVCQILFAKKFDKYEGLSEDIVKSAAHLIEIFADNRYMLVGLAYKIFIEFFPSTRRIRKARKLVRKVITEIVEEHIKTFDPENLRDYVDSYLYQANKLEKNGELNHTFTKDRLAAITLNMMMEGTETAGETIFALLDAACQHPEEQKLVQDELDSVVGRERLPSWIDRHKLPYCEAFIQELYRTNMAFNISTHYCNFEETSVRGYKIPKRTVFVANLWTANYDPEQFPEPSKFIPERFIDENGKKKKKEGPYPFGIGKRSCIAESLAQIEVFLVIASILQNFTLFPTEKSGFIKAISRS